MSSTVVGVGNNFTLPTNTFTNSGFSFVEWNTKADGTGLSYTDMQSIVNVGKAGEEIMLYAIWNNM